MPLTPAEQAELEALEKELGAKPAPTGLTPEEAEELRQLEAELGDTTPPAQPESDISAAESFGRGAMEDVSFGFIDELAGGLEATGSAFGVRGLGGKLSDVRLETDEEDKKSLSEIYREARDKKRREQAAAKEAHPTAFLAGEVTGGIAGAFVPGVGWVSSGGKLAAKTTVKEAAKAGAIGGMKSGAVYGAGKAEEFEDLPADVIGGAAIGGAAGGALGAAMEKVGQKANQYFRNKKQITEAGTQGVQAGKPLPDDVLDALGRSDTPLDMELFEKLVAEHPKAKFPGIRKAANDKQFVLSLTGNKANEKVDDALKQKAMDLMHGMNDELLQEQWITRKVKGDALAAVAKRSIESTEKAHQLASVPDLKSLAKVFVDPVQFGSKVDDRTGVPLTRILDKMHERANLASVETAAMMQEAGEKLKSIRWPKGDEAKLALIRQIKNKKTSKQSEQLEAVFDQLLERFNSKHKMNITKLEGEPYIPRYAADRGTVHSRMTKRLRKFDKLKEGDQKEVIEAVNTMKAALGRADEEITSPQEMLKIVGDWTRDKNVHETLNKNVFNAMLRKGPGLPILMRETDPSRLVMRYIQGNTRAAYMQEPMAEMQNAVRALDIMGQTQARDYFQKYLSDLASVNGGNLESIFQRGVRNPWMRTVDRLLPEDSVLKDNVKYLPDLLDWSSSNVYANLMGFRLDAPIRNMTTQPFFLTAPELTGGSKYGYKLIGKAYGKMVKDLFKKQNLPFNGQVGHMEDQLRKNGIQSAQHNLEASLPAFENGIRSVPGLGHLVKGVDKFAEVGMWLYTKSDTINRYITMNATHDLVDAMHKGSREAADSIKHWPASIRHEVARQLKAGRVDDAKRAATMYMNDKTQFIYSREGLNEAGRDYGRFISMFTKWPVNMTTEAAYALGDKQRRQMVLGQKLIGPALAVFAMNKGLEEMDAFDSPMGKLMFGKSVLAWDPMESLPLTGELTPPALQVAADLYHAADAAIEDGDAEEALEKSLKAIEPFTAVYGAAKAVRRRDNILSEALDNLGVEE